MSLGNLQQHYQHPLLAAISGNNYAGGVQQRLYNPYAMASQRPLHFQQRPLLAAATNVNGVYYGGSGAGGGHSGPGHSSGYGYEPSSGAGDYHTGPPSGGSYSHHSTAHGSNYAPPPPHPPSPPVHPHPPSNGGSKKSKQPKKGNASSAMSALTLLAFFFFMNMLQNCLKEHMDTMNPTVMVLTSAVVRNRFNKLAEMNSREQHSPTTPASPPPFSSTSTANAVILQPGSIIVGAAQTPTPPTYPALQSQQQVQSEGYYGKPSISHSASAPPHYNGHEQQHQVPSYGVGVVDDPQPEYYDDSGHSLYSNHSPGHHHYHHQPSSHHNYQPPPPPPFPHNNYDHQMVPHQRPLRAHGVITSVSASPSSAASSSSFSSSHELPPWSLGASAGLGAGATAAAASSSSYYDDGDDHHRHHYSHLHRNSQPHGHDQRESHSAYTRFN